MHLCTLLAGRKGMAMKFAVSLLLACSISGFAYSAQPTDESVRKLIDLSQATQAVASIQQQVDTMLQNTVRQATQGDTITPDMQKIIDDYQKKVRAMADEQLNADSLRGIYMQAYRDSFSQEEIDQLITFYETPTGKMFAAKMPLVMQKSTLSMQQKMGPMMKQMQQATQEMQLQLTALKQDPPK
jgi:hypothetical protein